MNTLLHYLRKDLRCVRWAILFIWFIAASVLWFPFVPLEKRAELITVWLWLSRYGLWMPLLTTSSRLIQIDAPLREGAFSRTRPVPLATLIRSKCLVILMLIVPMALFEGLMLLLLGLHPSVTDLLLVFAENLLALATIAAIGMAIALRVDSAGKFIASIAGMGVIILIGYITYTWCRNTYFQNEKPDWSHDLEYLKSSRMLMAWLVALAGAVSSIVLFTRSRRRESISAALALTALSTIATLLFWPLNFVKSFAPPTREAPQSEWPDQTKLKFTFEKKWVGGDNNKKSVLYCADSGYGSVIYRRIDAYGSLTGLTDDWKAADDSSYQSLLTLSNGKSFPKSSKAWSGLGWRSILPQFGIPNPYTIVGKQIRQFALTEFKLEDAADALTGAKLSGTMKIHLKRPVILTRIPLRTGTSTVVDGRLITITDVANSGNEIRCNVVLQTHMVHLQGGRQKLETHRFEYAVIHAARKEFLDPPTVGETNLRAGHYSVQNHRITGHLLDIHSKEEPIPPDWADGAELIITGDENGGSFSQSFDFPNISLSNER